MIIFHHVLNIYHGDTEIMEVHGDYSLGNLANSSVTSDTNCSLIFTALKLINRPINYLVSFNNAYFCVTISVFLSVLRVSVVYLFQFFICFMPKSISTGFLLHISHKSLS